MAPQVAWASEARADLGRIVEYLAADSPAYASVLVEAILDRIDHLGQFPRMGRIVPELGDESFREIIVHNYRVMYRLEGDAVTIAAVIHTKRSLDLPT